MWLIGRKSESGDKMTICRQNLCTKRFRYLDLMSTESPEIFCYLGSSIFPNSGMNGSCQYLLPRPYQCPVSSVSPTELMLVPWRFHVSRLRVISPIQSIATLRGPKGAVSRVSSKHYYLIVLKVIYYQNVKMLCFFIFCLFFSPGGKHEKMP